MPNKNSIESEIDKVVGSLSPSICMDTRHDYWDKQAKLATKQLKYLIQREVKKGRVEELKRNAYYSQPRKTDPLKLCGIDMTAKQVLDRLEELEG